MVREHAGRLGAHSGRTNQLLRRDDEIEAKVVSRFRKVLVEHLHGVHRRRNDRRVIDGADLPPDRVFEVGVATSLSDTNSGAVDGDRAGDDEIDMRQFAWIRRAPESRRALDRRRLRV
jgi:hypothetical protein